MSLRNVKVEFNPDRSCSIEATREDGQAILAYAVDWIAAMRRVHEMYTQHNGPVVQDKNGASYLAHRMDLLERRLGILEGRAGPGGWSPGSGS